MLIIVVSWRAGKSHSLIMAESSSYQRASAFTRVN
jgi:hypothetical protein